MQDHTKQDYPLTVDQETAKQLADNIHDLIKSLTNNEKLSEENYQSLNRITGQLFHPPI